MDDGGPRGRREALLARLHVQGACGVDALARDLYASPAMIRRDLAALEGQGLIDRSWGGARPRVVLHDHLADLARAERAHEAKRALAWAAPRW